MLRALSVSNAHKHARLCNETDTHINRKTRETHCIILFEETLNIINPKHMPFSLFWGEREGLKRKEGETFCALYYYYKRDTKRRLYRKSHHTSLFLLRYWNNNNNNNTLYARSFFGEKKKKKNTPPPPRVLYTTTTTTRFCVCVCITHARTQREEEEEEEVFLKEICISLVVIIIMSAAASDGGDDATKHNGRTRSYYYYSREEDEDDDDDDTNNNNTNNNAKTTTKTTTKTTLESKYSTTNRVPALMYTLGYLIFSTITVVSNKHLIKDAGFGNPIFVSSCGTAFACVASAILVHGKMVEITEPEDDDERMDESVRPGGSFSSITLACANVVYVYLSLSFVQMLKAFVPVVTYATHVCVGTDKYNSDFTVSLLAMVVGGVMCMNVSGKRPRLE